VKNPQIQITDKHYTTNYTILKYSHNGYCSIHLDEPFPWFDEFPYRSMVGKSIFLIWMDKKDYRQVRLNSVLN